MASKEVEMRELNDEQTTDEELEISHVVPPDGGYGWVIMFAAFMCNVVVDGIIFTFGLVVTSLSESMDVSVSTAAWVASLLTGFYLLAGPFVSALSNRYGFRVVTISGAIMAATSLAVSSFAPSIEFLFISVGVFGGIGFGVIFLPAVVAVGYYFDKKRALATGIAVCGSGVGTFILAPFTAFLLEEYGWRGTMLIQSGLVLNCAVFGSLFRPLEPVRSKRQRLNAEIPTSDGTPLMLRIKRDRDDNLQSEAATDNDTACADSLANMEIVEIKDARASEESSDLLHEKKGLLDDGASISIVKSGSRPLIDSSKSLNQKEPRPLDRDDAFFTGSVQKLPQYLQNPNNYHASVTRVPDVDEPKDACSKCCPESARRTLLTMMDFTLFKSMSFVLLCFSSFLTFVGFFVPFMFLAARAEVGNASKEEASFLLSIVGITNTIGRVICGAIADHPKVSVLFLNNAALTSCGLLTILSPFLPSYEMLMVYAALFGLTIAGVVSIRSILLVELLGLERLTNSFGLILPFTGISSCVGGPLAGKFYDVTKDYDASFYLAGGMILLSGVMCYPLGYVNKWEKKSHLKVQPIPEPTPKIVVS